MQCAKLSRKAIVINGLLAFSYGEKTESSTGVINQIQNNT